MKKMGTSSDIYAAVIGDLTFDPDGDAMLTGSVPSCPQ
jgi:hypothetical protein